MMIEIPFSREMRLASLNGNKIMTTRSQTYGEPGDFFILGTENDGNAYFQIIDVWELQLNDVRDKYYRLEGFESPEAFELFWRQLHRGQFSHMKYYFSHFYGRYDLVP